MDPFDPARHPHRRLNPLTGEWITVSPHRTDRPWRGQAEAPPVEHRPAHDPGCYLCPRNVRASGLENPDYAHTYVFDNDFSGLLADAVEPRPSTDELFQAVPTRGVCRVLCFSPRHDLTLTDMPADAIARVVDVWAEQTDELGARPDIASVMLFENRGAMMGASSPHPHGQIWATEQVPVALGREVACQAAYHERHGRALLGDYLERELERAERIVCVNDHFVALVPYWATWPFETLVLPRRPVRRLPELDATERSAVADLIRRLMLRYDNLFVTPFPFSMGWHQAPADGGAHPGFVLHAHFFPPLLRSATVRKFMVGFEMLGEPVRDLTAEAAAARLAALPEVSLRAVGEEQPRPG